MPSSLVKKCHSHLLMNIYVAAAAAGSLFCSFPLTVYLAHQCLISAPLLYHWQDIAARFLLQWYFNRVASCHTHSIFDWLSTGRLNRYLTMTTAIDTKHRWKNVDISTYTILELWCLYWSKIFFQCLGLEKINMFYPFCYTKQLNASLLNEKKKTCLHKI